MAGGCFAVWAPPLTGQPPLSFLDPPHCGPWCQVHESLQRPFSSACYRETLVKGVPDPEVEMQAARLREFPASPSASP